MCRVRIDSVSVSYFKTFFVPQIASVLDILETRLLPNLSKETLEAEADAKADESWEHQPASEWTDPANLAEQATEAGLAHYELMHGLRQGMINLVAVALYHLFEQQLKDAFGIERDEEIRELLSAFVDQRLCSAAVNTKIKELREVANTVKHGKGRAFKELFEWRPDMFVNPLLRKLGDSDPPYDVQPLIGEGLYVRLEHLREYRDSLKGFWMHLSAQASP